MSPQDTGHKINLTDEQEEVVSRDLKRGDVLKVIAFAGTGKTSTLLEYAAARPQLRFLYVAFNRSVKIEAERKFPGNVVSRTAHGLAFGPIGSAYSHKLVNQLKENTVRRVLEIDSLIEGRIILDTLKNYLVSKDRFLSSSHIPWGMKAEKKKTGYYLDNAKKLWNMMKDLNLQEPGMLHDGYLKLFQLTRPTLEYDCILLDEAQDTNPVTADIILSQRCPKILVGDPHQQIYSFRGAVDAMDFIKGSETLYLTHSFRFGHEIAWLANKILDTFKGERKRLVGAGNQEGAGNSQAILARTNAEVFDQAVSMCGEAKIGFLGGIQGYPFNKILDTYFLFKGQRSQVTDVFLRSFACFQELEDFAKEMEDWEILSLCKVVSKYCNEIPFLIEKVGQATVYENEADVILATAHKAKGREFDRIKICDDYPGFPKNGEEQPKILDDDEFNLLYVTVTRSKQQIEFQSPFSWANFICKDSWPGYEEVLRYFGLHWHFAPEEANSREVTHPASIKTNAVNKYQDIYLDEKGVQHLEEIIEHSEVDREKAAEMLELMMEEYPNSPQLCISMGIIKPVKFITEKFHFFEKAIELDPGNYNGFRWVSRCIRASAFLLGKVSGSERVRLNVAYLKLLSELEAVQDTNEAALIVNRHQELFDEDWRDYYRTSLSIMAMGLAVMDRQRYSEHLLKSFEEEFDLAVSVRHEIIPYIICFDYHVLMCGG